MQVRVEVSQPLESGAELVAVGRFEEEDVPYGLASEPGGAESRGGEGKWTLIHPRDAWRESSADGGVDGGGVGSGGVGSGGVDGGDAGGGGVNDGGAGGGGVDGGDAGGAPGGGGAGGARRVLVVGLGKREELDGERLRVAASVAAEQARRLRLPTIAWDLTCLTDPATSHGESPRSGSSGAEVLDATATATAAALIDGTALTDWRFDRFKSKSGSTGTGADSAGADAAEDETGPVITSLTLVTAPGGHDADDESLAELRRAAEFERVAVAAQNRARDLQSLPGNHLTPAALAERAAQVAASFDTVTDETLGPDRIAQLEMGGLLAVSRGSEHGPHLIVLRYNGADAHASGSGAGGAPVLGLVGKSVTFDTGGISLKPPASMPDMKMDMSGGAAVLEAVAAIAELGLPLNLVAVLPAVENMPSGTAIKPGDIITQYSGKTVEVNNTDAEGRLILADALAYCIEAGAGRVVDLATLTGAVLIALGSTYSGLIANDDELAASVANAGDAAGEPAWRLPLHREYRELTRGKMADLSNAGTDRKAGTIYAGAFLEQFVGDTPWAHLDIAGTAWDTSRRYFAKGPTGVGTRLLINLARAQAAIGA